MKQRYLILFLMLFTRCGSDGWKQFHADGQNQGNISVHSPETLRPKWKNPFVLGQVSYASPVIDNAGTIYIGTTDGAMVAVNNNGTQKWRFETKGNPMLNLPNTTIVSAGAVGMDNDVYFIVSFTNPGKFANSALVHLNNEGNLICFFLLEARPVLLPAWTTSAPKILHLNSRDFIFISVSGFLYVFDSNCQQITRQDVLHCTGSLQGGTPGVLDIDFDLLNEFDAGPSVFQSWHNVDDAGYWIDPSIAIVTKINGKNLEIPVIVVVTNKCGIQTWNWTPPPNPSLALRWTSQGDDDTFYSSPAVSTGGELVIGFRDGYIRSKDVLTGNDNWLYRVPSKEPVLASMAFYAGSLHVFAVSLHDVYVIDNNSVLLSSFHLSGQTMSSPAVTYDRVFVSSSAGIHSLKTDLSGISTDAAFQGGMSSPAVDKDGTIYFVSADGKLIAYAGR